MSNSQKESRGITESRDCAKDGINPSATSLEIFCSSCVTLRTAFQQLFTFWVQAPTPQLCTTTRALQRPGIVQKEHFSSLVTKPTSMKLTAPFHGLHSSSQHVQQYVHVTLQSYPQDDLFGKQFIWELHNILNSPKYILLDPYKRNLNKYNDTKLNLLQQLLNIYFH